MAAIGSLFIWLGMWRYWVRIDDSRAWIKRKKQGGYLKSIFAELSLSAGCSSMMLLAIFPKLALLIPHPELIRVFLIPFVLISLVYGIVTLFRLGMKRAKD